MDRKQCCIGHKYLNVSRRGAGLWVIVLVINPQKRQKQLFFLFPLRFWDGWWFSQWVCKFRLEVPRCPSAHLPSQGEVLYVHCRGGHGRTGAGDGFAGWTFEDGLLTPNEIIPMRYGSRDQYNQDFMYFHEFSSVQVGSCHISTHPLSCSFHMSFNQVNSKTEHVATGCGGCGCQCTMKIDLLSWVPYSEFCVVEVFPLLFFFTGGDFSSLPL